MNLIAFLLLGLLLVGCGKSERVADSEVRDRRAKQAERSLSYRSRLPDERLKTFPLALVLVPQPGEGRTDREIRRCQEQVRSGTNDIALERLGWLFVAKARESFDPGYYKLAEQCGSELESRQSRSSEALLLRGYALENLHRFKDAEPLARELVTRRGRAFDYGLLGDVLMEQGRLEEAVVFYQKMADLKPDLHAYTRAAHMRWLKGDLAGAIEMMQLAVDAASPLDAESAAWVYSRMALFQLQAGAMEKVRRYCAAATEFVPDYPPALLVQGRLLLAEGKPFEAVSFLMRAETRNPVPEYQWALAEALRASNRMSEAALIEKRLKQSGATTDPRTFALYLASQHEAATTAIRLACAEMETRSDVFTHDALAWALAADARWQEAEAQIRQALAEGTQDARLFLHAGVIAEKLGRVADARNFFQQAGALQQMLLPSEKKRLFQCVTHIRTTAAGSVDASSSDWGKLSTSSEANPQSAQAKNQQNLERKELVHHA